MAAPLVPATPGTWVSFGGYTLTYLTTFSVQQGQAQEFELVTMSSKVRGAGVYAVPLTTVLIGSVKPGRLKVSGLGNWFSTAATGTQGVLSIGAAGFTTFNVKAFLVTSSREAQTNDVWKVSAEFQFMEAD